MNATIPVLMASIEINYNIMGPPGSTDPDKTLSPDKSLDREIDFQPERPVQNRMDPFIRSEGSPPNNPSFLDLLGGSDPPMSYGSTTATVKGHAAFGVGGKRQRTAGADERIRFDPSIDLMGTGNNFENRGFSATDPARSSLSSALMNDDSFEMDENLVGFIDINDPMGSLPLTDTFEDNNDSYAYPHHPTQASKDALYFGGPLDRFSQNQDLTGVKMNNRKAPPTASSATEIRMKSLKTPPSASTQRSEQSHHGQSVRKSNPKAPPVRSLSGRTSLRSYRATSLATKMDDNTKNRPSEVIKLTRSKTCVGSNAKTINKEMNLSLSMQPTQTQMTEARGPRKVEALRTWYKRLGELICFKDSHGHANVPQKYAKNHKLGIWVNKQRMEKKAKDAGKGSSLTDEKIQLLEEAGFVWAKTKGQTAWEEKFSELQDYLRDNGHCNVPTKNKNNRALGRWVSTQRSNHKKFQSGELLKHPRMDQEELERRISRLNGIGFAWSLLPGTTRFEGDDDNEGKRNESTTHSTTSPEKKEEDDHDGADIDSPY